MEVTDMKLLDLLDSNYIRLSSDANDKDSVLREIASMVAEGGKAGAASADHIYDAFVERESLGSTGFGHGVAIPHCRIQEVRDFIVGMLITSRGVDFDSIDGESVRIFPFVVGPETEPKEYLKILSSIAQILRRKDIRKKLVGQRVPEDVCKVLRSQIKPEESDLPRRPGMKMMHVFIQDEDLFDDILQVFTGSDGISAMVLEAHESTDYLMKGPFFAGFWDSQVQRFNRLIIAVVRNELVNSTVRNIEYISGKLEEKDDILVTVTDLHYTLGSLSI
jgi:nitrogen PTS system EIIA component